VQQSETATRYGAWFVIRLALLAGCAVSIICAYATRSIVPCIVTAAFAFAAALLDAWALRVRHIAEPVNGGVRVSTVLDTWQPVAAFAFLSLLGIAAEGSDPFTRVLLVALVAATWTVIFVSRRIFD
jgi:hypothetical protein